MSEIINLNEVKQEQKVEEKKDGQQEQKEEVKNEEKKPVDYLVLQKDLTAKLINVISEGNYPFPMVISTFEIIKFELMTNSYFTKILEKNAMEEGRKRIVMPQNKIPNFKKR